MSERVTKKHRGMPSDGLDGSKHHLALPSSPRLGKAVGVEQPALPKQYKKQSSPGAPKKDFADLSEDYIERYALHFMWLNVDVLGNFPLRTKRSWQLSRTY